VHHGEIDDEKANRAVLPFCQIEQLPNLVLDCRDRTEEDWSSSQLRISLAGGCHTKALQLHDIGLRPDLLDECPLGSWPPHRRLRSRAGKDCSYRSASRVLDHEEDASEDDSEQEAYNEVPSAGI